MIVCDFIGIALGGVRSPYIDVPVVGHTGCACGMTGAKRPFTTEKLNARYSDQGAYAAKFARETGRLLNGRWITPEDDTA